MKRYHIFALLLAIGFSACNDDNPEAGPSYQGDNTNSNATRIFASVTERPNVTDVHKAACRLEIPQLNKAGDNNLFIVHTTTDFGINYCMEYDCTLKAQRWSAFRWDDFDALLIASTPLLPTNKLSIIATCTPNYMNSIHREFGGKLKTKYYVTSTANLT